ncbi:hypothetical protein ACFBZI_07695 [Moraxella sp. ZJ142]|uniref:hypothetical protein n=1 Tax=Moraxella marmotae TaxID=3344520 RepID=UPI0035D4A293
MLKTYSKDGKLLVGLDGDFLKLVGFITVPANKNAQGRINFTAPADRQKVYMPIAQGLARQDFAVIHVDNQTGDYRYLEPYKSDNRFIAVEYRIYYGYI